MSSIIIQSDLKKITITRAKRSIWYVRIESFVYIILFFSAMFFVLYKSKSTFSLSSIIVIIFSVIFIIIIVRDRKRFINKAFSIELTKNGLIVNNSIVKEVKTIDKITIKETVDTYSANAYYDLYAISSGVKYLISDGVTESDKNAIIQSLRLFFKPTELYVGID